MAPSMIAASATVFVIGPAVSGSAVIGITPYRLIRPMVGRMPTSMLALEGLMIDPPVSEPTLPAQKFAAVPTPELEPPVCRTGRPSPGSARGSGRGSYGL